MCRQHGSCAMLQIFSLKLITTNLSPLSASIEIYRFMAVWDLLDPLRSYLFNRSRDDPLVIHHHDLHSDDPCFIYLSGPTRGVYLEAPVLLEYDMKIKTEGGQDKPLIEGAVIFSNYASGTAITTQIIGGDHSAVAVEICHARFLRALEATVQVRIIELTKQQDNYPGGLDLSITGFVPKIPNIPEDIMLFRGVVDEPCELNRFVIAVASNSFLILHFDTRDAAGSRRFGLGFRATPDGGITHCQKFDFATVEVKVTWSSLITLADDMM